MQISNPIIPGCNPDPTCIRVGDDYFLVTSTFEYYPGLPIYHSKDLTSWKLIGHALNRKSQLNMRTVESGGGIFAPSLRMHKGRFYLACCACYRVPNMENFHKVSRSGSIGLIARA
jgi:alpha-N-arabinofuranosidase